MTPMIQKRCVWLHNEIFFWCSPYLKFPVPKEVTTEMKTWYGFVMPHYEWEKFSCMLQWGVMQNWTLQWWTAFCVSLGAGFSPWIHKASGNHFVQAQASEFFHKIDAENVSLPFLFSFVRLTSRRVPLCFLWGRGGSVSERGVGMNCSWDAALWHKL